jgi:hypothetical protein
MNHLKILEELGVSVDTAFCVFFADLIHASNGKIRRQSVDDQVAWDQHMPDYSMVRFFKPELIL